MVKRFYRYVDPMTLDQRELDCHEYRVAKETPCGYWLYLVWGYSVEDDAKVPQKGHWMWRSKAGHYAFEDKADALRSYIMRKGRHIDVLEHHMEKAKHGLFLAYGLKSGEPTKPQKGFTCCQRLC